MRGTFVSWGSNSHYQLALSTQEDQLAPCKSAVLHTELGPIESIGGGGAHSYVLSGGAVYMCGWNKDGQTGSSKPANDVILPTRVLSLPAVRRVACGWGHTVVCTLEGAVFAWGSNAFGQLGTEKVGASSCVPVLLDDSVFEGESVVSVSCGMRHSGCVSVGGRGYTWGSGNKGQLGRGGSNKVPGLFGSDELKGIQIVELCMGNGHTVAMTEDRSVFVCGDNSYGQCGMECASDKPYIFAPVKVVGLDGVIKIDCGWQHSLLLTEKGEVFSWGRCDYGQLGRQVVPGGCTHGDKGSSEIKRVEIGVKIVDIKCGAQHSMSLTEAGDIFSWGWNEHGMCGNGKEENVKLPVQLEMKEKVLKIGCGDGTSFAVLK